MSSFRIEIPNEILINLEMDAEAAAQEFKLPSSSSNWASCPRVVPLSSRESRGCNSFLPCATIRLHPFG